jgi:hypothetical protein
MENLIKILWIIIPCKFQKKILIKIFVCFSSHILPDYFVVQPMVRDAKEYLVIDRTHEDIQIQSKNFEILIF